MSRMGENRRNIGGETLELTQTQQSYQSSRITFVLGSSVRKRFLDSRFLNLASEGCNSFPLVRIGAMRHATAPCLSFWWEWPARGKPRSADCWQRSLAGASTKATTFILQPTSKRCAAANH